MSPAGDNDQPAKSDDKEAKAKAPKPAAAPTPAETGPFAVVRETADRFRDTAKWIVGTFAAVWTAAVASTPFTAFGDLEGCDLVIASVGLALAGVGAVAAIYAVSTVLEPQDISFAELKKRLKGDVKLNIWQKLFPGKTTTAQLIAIVNAEKEAYFGPRGKLDGLYAGLLAAEGVLHKAKVAGAKASAGTAAKQKSADAATKAAQLEVDRLDDRYMSLLATAALYDIRRKFMVARRIIVIAALLVVGGVTLYFGVVSAEEDEDSGDDAAPVALESVALHPVSATIDATRAAELNRLAGDGCLDGVERAALVVGDPTTDGPWELIVPGGDGCETIRFELDGEDGAIEVPAP